MLGFQVFCEEAVRFTHAFTPSVMSQSAMASIMTGLYPHEHKVLNNGGDFLSSEFTTLSERAVEVGMRTGFFSGGAPIWRKSGLSQGFELFEDNISIGLGRLYRPVVENFELFIDWLHGEVGKDPFLSVIYLPDLQFQDVTTMTDLGEIRDRSYGSQLKEIGESLNFLVQELKKQNRWDSTHVVLVGLNGKHLSRRPNEIDSYSLFSPNTQIGLFIKPARKKRDLGIEWKIDKNVSLVDLGATLYDLIGMDPPYPNDRNLKVVSLKTVLDRPSVNWDEERAIVIQSGWPQWHGFSGVRMAMRKKHLLYFFDQKEKIYNTLVDRLEISPISTQDPMWVQEGKNMREFFRQKGESAWEPLSDSMVRKLQVGRKIWRDEAPTESDLRDLRELSKKRPKDRQLIGWQGALALENQDWAWLEQAGKDGGNSLWRYVAALNMGRSFKFKARGCERLLFVGRVAYKKPSPQQCDNELLISLMEWIHEEDSNKALHLQAAFLRKYIWAKIDERVARLNYLNELQWDVPASRPSGPLIVDLALALPHNRKYAWITNNRLSRENN